MSDNSEDTNSISSINCECDNFLNELLQNYADYLQMFKTDSVDKDLRYNYVFTRDDRLEQPLEKIIRQAKAEILIPSEYNDGNCIESVIQDQSNLPKNSEYYFNGYLAYLLTAWKNHLGIEVAPWFFWNIILYNLKELNKQNPEKYRKLWTKQSGNQQITINADTFDIKSYINNIKNLCPTDTIDKLYVKFANQPDNYEESMYGLLADMSNEYYNCMILSCNIPTVRVLGSIDEWTHLSESIENVKNHYSDNDCLTINIERYLDKCNEFIKECSSKLNDESFWMKFFYIDRCGSGHQQKIDGNVTNLLLDQETLIGSLPKLTSRFNFGINNGSSIKKGSYISGFMSGNNIDNVLVGCYSYITTKYKFEDVLEDEIQEKTDLVRCLEILNSYSRPNVHHNIPPERAYNETLELKNVLIGKCSVDDHINILKEQQNKNYDLEKTRETLLKTQQEFKGKTLFDIIEICLDRNKKKMSKMKNFWDGNEFNRQRLSKPIVDNVKWIHGRRIQETEKHAELLCKNMDNVFNYLMDRVQMYSMGPIEINTSYIINIFLASYHEDVYRKLMDVAPLYTKYTDKSSKKNECFTKDNMVCEIFMFLFNGLMADECEVGRDTNETNRYQPKTTQLTFHKGLVLEYLVRELLSTNIDCEKCTEGFFIFYKNLPKEISLILKENHGSYTKINNLVNVYKNLNSKVMNEMFRWSLMFNFISRSYEYKNSDGHVIKDFKELFNFILSQKHPNIVYSDTYGKDRFEYFDQHEGKTCKLPVYIEDILKLSVMCNTDYDIHILDPDYHMQSSYDKDPLSNLNQCLWFSNEIITKYPDKYPKQNEKKHKIVNWDRFTNKTSEHSELYNSITSNIDEIYKFLFHNDSNGTVIKSLIYTLNVNFISVFIDKFFEQPYLLDKSTNYLYAGTKESMKIFAVEDNSDILNTLKNLTSNSAILQDYVTKYDLLIHCLIELDILTTAHNSFIDVTIVNSIIQDLCNRYKKELKYITNKFLSRIDIYINFLLKKDKSVSGQQLRSPELGIIKLNECFGHMVRKIVQIESLIDCETITLELLSEKVSESLQKTVIYDSFDEQRDKQIYVPYNKKDNEELLAILEKDNVLSYSLESDEDIVIHA